MGAPALHTQQTTSQGLSFAQLAARAPESTTFGDQPLRMVLRSEAKAGRISSTNGVYRINAEAWPADMLQALADLELDD